MESLWRVLVGPALRARDLVRQQITPVEGLPALSLDALTSVAYGPEAIIVVLALAGAGALHLVVPITVAIVALLAIINGTGAIVTAAATVIFLFTKFTAGAWVVVLTIPCLSSFLPEIYCHSSKSGTCSAWAALWIGLRSSLPWWWYRWPGSPASRSARSPKRSLSAHTSSPHGAHQRSWPRHRPGARAAGAMEPLEPGTAAGRTAHRVRLRSRAHTRVRRPALRTAHRANRGPDTGGRTHRLRYTFLHNHLDLVLTAALRRRPEIVTARVPVPVRLPDRRRGAQAKSSL